MSDDEAPTINGGQEYYEIEDIIDMRIIRGRYQFLIKWEGYGEEANTWEPEANLRGCEDVVQQYIAHYEKVMKTEQAILNQNRPVVGGSSQTTAQAVNETKPEQESETKDETEETNEDKKD